MFHFVPELMDTAGCLSTAARGRVQREHNHNRTYSSLQEYVSGH